MAGRIADGVILLAGLFEDGIDFALSHIQRGAQLSSRQPPPIAAFMYGSIRGDRRLAIDEARSISAWFPQTAPVYCELAGMPLDLVQQVLTAYSGGEFQEAALAARLIPDEMVTKLALAGTADDAARKINMLHERGIDSFNIFPLGTDRINTIRQFAECALAATG
jgi:5,10-methylenetetrahydromethanopterin reductase